MPPFADGGVHAARVTFVPQPPPDALSAALSSASFRGAGENTRAALAAGGTVGLLQVFVDDLSTPLLSVPLAPQYFLRPGGSGAVYAGFTAANGDAWHAADVLSWSM